MFIEIEYKSLETNSSADFIDDKHGIHMIGEGILCSVCDANKIEFLEKDG